MVCAICNLPSEFGRIGRRVSQTARLMIGQPDYRIYVAHRRATHPDEPLMSEVEFFRERENARFGAGGASRVFRCC
jgi:uncharacterized short protein YbdD (DUF466 family)